MRRCQCFECFWESLSDSICSYSCISIIAFSSMLRSSSSTFRSLIWSILGFGLIFHFVCPCLCLFSYSSLCKTSDNFATIFCFRRFWSRLSMTSCPWILSISEGSLIFDSHWAMTGWWHHSGGVCDCRLNSGISSPHYLLSVFFSSIILNSGYSWEASADPNHCNSKFSISGTRIGRASNCSDKRDLTHKGTGTHFLMTWCPNRWPGSKLLYHFPFSILPPHLQTTLSIKLAT